MEIKIITTGGTIDKTYDELIGTLENRRPLIKTCVLDKLRLPYTELEVIGLMAKDSLNMGEADRKIILDCVKEQLDKNAAVLVVHGTDTMQESATYCFDHLGSPAHPVVFTGSMRPIGFEDSDGRQNLTEALLACKLLDPGVFISFHSEIFKVPFARKNRTLGTFEHTDMR